MCLSVQNTWEYCKEPENSNAPKAFQKLTPIEGKLARFYLIIRTLKINKVN